MTFPPEEGWPFPSYFGSCGRLAAFNFSGPSLSSFIDSPWQIRVVLAIKLLQIANHLSNNSLRLGIYPTDWDADNISVELTVDGEVDRVVIVDLENIIVVNQTEIHGDEIHAADNFGCEKDQDCFSYSPWDLCSHSMTDHNQHAVCSVLLAPSPHSSLGSYKCLLHSPPTGFISRHPHLLRVLNECWRSKISGGRIEAAKKLEQMLMDDT